MSEQLIQSWLNGGDEQAAEELYQTHHKQVFRLAYGLLGDSSDAEEVMQDTLVHALTHMDQFDPQRASFTTWLHTITVSHCRGRKGYKHLSKDSSDTMSNPQVVFHPASDLEKHPERLQVWQALDRLRPQLREAIVLRYWGNHTYQEIAQILNCPLSTAQSRVRMAFEQLRKIMAPTGVPALGGENLQ